MENHHFQRVNQVYTAIFKNHVKAPEGTYFTNRKHINLGMVRLTDHLL
jgi:hypothetical protein